MKSYTRPEPRPLELRLKDILEDEVEERYYLTDEQVASFVASTERAKAKGNGFKFEPFERERERVMHAILSRAGSRQTDNFIAESIDLAASTTSQEVNTKQVQSMIHKESPQHLAQCKAATKSQSSSHHAAEGSITCNI